MSTVGMEWSQPLECSQAGEVNSIRCFEYFEPSPECLQSWNEKLLYRNSLETPLTRVNAKYTVREHRNIPSWNSDGRRREQREYQSHSPLNSRKPLLTATYRRRNNWKDKIDVRGRAWRKRCMTIKEVDREHSPVGKTLLGRPWIAKFRLKRSKDDKGKGRIIVIDDKTCSTVWS